MLRCHHRPSRNHRPKVLTRHADDPFHSFWSPWACGKPSGGACRFTAMAGASLLLNNSGPGPDPEHSAAGSAGAGRHPPCRRTGLLRHRQAHGIKLVIGMEGNLPSKVRPGWRACVDPPGNRVA
jgi:hypothetical protein